jgi:glycosyltransferase involved in cell wall biosynthesis
MPADRVDAVWRLPFFKITIAQWLVDLGRKRFGIQEMALVPNSVDDGFRNAAQRTKGNPPTVGFLFHNAHFKDFPATRATITRLKEIRPDARFLSFGSMMPAPGELPADVEYHHLPSQETIAEIYRRCDAWLSTSRTEGFNLPPLEAMAGGCPAVCGKTGRPDEIIQNGINGYLVDAGDVQGFAEALANILKLSNESWKNMSDAARDAVARPTWGESSELFEEALLSINGSTHWNR